jgi:hypothetical protein
MWVLAAIAALALGVASVVIGFNILPGPSKASRPARACHCSSRGLSCWVGVSASITLARFILSARPKS